MALFRLIYLAIGLGLLGWILAGTDLSSVWHQALSVGALGIVVVLVLFALEFMVDVAGWQVTFRTIPLDFQWLRRLYLVRMVGEAFNAVTPMASMGGEPVKVVLLKKYYGVGYGEASASIILAKTANLISLVVFLAGGLVLMLQDPRFSSTYLISAATGFVAFSIVVAAFFLVQRLRVSSRLSARVSQWPYGGKIAEALHHIEAFDNRLAEFYIERKARFVAAMSFALCNWFIGALGVYFTMIFIRVPVSFAEAWVIEAFAQLVRAGTFFIPASIGAQEGAFVLACGVFTGSPAAGLAAALIRRFRELVWIGSGLGLGWWFSFQASFAAELNSHNPDDAQPPPTPGGRAQPR